MSGKYEKDLNTKSKKFKSFSIINIGKTKGKLAEAYAELVTSAKNGSVARMEVSNFKSLIARCNSSFIGYGQQDSQEFLRFALDEMSADLNRIKTKPKYKELKFKKETKHEQSEKWWEYFMSIEDSHITDLFQGQLISVTK